MSDLFSEDRSRFLVIVKGQFLILILLVGLAYIESWDMAYSVLIGGLIPILANWFFAWRVFNHYSANRQGEIVGRFYRAEAEKLLMVALIFALLFIYIDSIHVVGLFVSYILLQFAHVALYQILGK